MKKLFLSIFLASSLLVQGSTMAFASDSHSNANIKSIFEKAIVSTSTTDSKTQYGILKSKDGKGVNYKVKLFPCDTPSNKTVKSDSKLSSTAKGTIKTQSYVFSLNSKYMTKLSENKTQSYSLASSEENDKTRRKWDDSDSVKGILTLYYTQNNNDYLLTKVSGSWDIEDDSVVVTPNWVIYANTRSGDDQWEEKYPNDLSFDYDTGFTTPLNSYTSIGGVGATSDATISHGNDSWDLQVQNQIFGNLPDLP